MFQAALVVIPIGDAEEDGDMAVTVTRDRSAGELRSLARRERNGRVASRLLAIANVLDAMSRADAARAAGMDRQTLRDWVIRYNEEGLGGLRDGRRGIGRRR